MNTLQCPGCEGVVLEALPTVKFGVLQQDQDLVLEVGGSKGPLLSPACTVRCIGSWPEGWTTTEPWEIDWGGGLTIQS